MAGQGDIPGPSATLRAEGLRPRKRLGQNFLRDPRLVEYLLDRSSITAGDCVLEIGPGRGIITAQLARRCRRVIAVEKDANLARSLRGAPWTRFANSAAVTIYEGDFLCRPLPREPKLPR